MNVVLHILFSCITLDFSFKNQADAIAERVLGQVFFGKVIFVKFYSKGGFLF